MKLLTISGSLRDASSNSAVLDALPAAIASLGANSVAEIVGTMNVSPN